MALASLPDTPPPRLSLRARRMRQGARRRRCPAPRRSGEMAVPRRRRASPHKPAPVPIERSKRI